MVAVSLGLWTAFAAAESDDAFIPRVINSSTIPSNGDVNPYYAVIDDVTNTLSVYRLEDR
jgi:hypothetical protein